MTLEMTLDAKDFPGFLGRNLRSALEGCPREWMWIYSWRIDKRCATREELCAHFLTPASQFTTTVSGGLSPSAPWGTVIRNRLPSELGA